MATLRRRHVLTGAALLPAARLRMEDPEMGHVVLLGDSVLDNGAYVGAGPDVVSQVREVVPRRLAGDPAGRRRERDREHSGPARPAAARRRTSC